MRLHRLSMTAIGPFADTVEIDFTRLGQQGLFLLEGPTGSGKSTVIDAICFALYGRVAQASADNERLRSHHVAADVVPVVDLVFETQSGIYRIRRTPQYRRPKKRGAGFTLAQATIKMWRLTSPDDPATGEPLSTSFREADDEILRAVGLSHSQFVQTMVLPQGEFATFLRSDTDDKRKLLQRLFGTEIVARTQAQLIEGRRRAMALRDAAEKAVDRAVHAFCAAADLDSDQTATLAATPVADLVAAAGEHLIRLADIESAAARTGRLATAALTRARRAHDAALDLAQRRARRDALRRRAAQLADAEREHGMVRAERDAAERAALVEPVATALAAALASLEVAERADLASRADVAADLREADESTLDTAVAERKELVGRLREFVRMESALPALAAESEELAAAVAELADTISSSTARAASLPARIASLSADREAALVEAAQLPSLRAECERARARLAAARQAVELEQAAKLDEQITSAALSALEVHEQRLAVLKATHRASIAAELGLALQVGEACQVCGSVEHPRPATPGVDYVSKEEVDRAESERAHLAEQLESARSQLQSQRLRLRELQTAADQNPPETAAEKLADAERRHDSAQAAQTRADELAAELATLQSLETQLTTAIRQAELRRAELAEQHKSSVARLTSDERAVSEHRGDHATVADRVEALADEIARLIRARDAAASLRVACGHAQDCGDALRASLDQHEFAGEQAWRAALRTSSHLAQLRAAVRQIEDEAAAVRDGLAEPALNDPALDADPADLDSLAASLASADVAATEAQHLLAEARTRHNAAARQHEGLTKALDAGRQVLADTEAAIRIGNLVSGNGDNRLKMELTTYVLVRRFTEVIAAANAQLRHISDGRYVLEHTESRSGNSRSGLGLQVHDHFTGLARDPKTLSGGEAFYVALSLALGLADVVRSESGGVDMGTLFIDEGFGSLDPDTLDDVMGVLQNLRAGGRVVGIVSHVQELKSRIADRIEIIPRADRSSTLRVVA